MAKLGLAFISAILISINSFVAHADEGWVLGLGANSAELEGTGVNVDLGAIAVSAGYRFNIGEGFALIPEVRFGVGIGEDDFVDVDGDEIEVEIADYYSIGLRIQYEPNDQLYLFVAPTWMEAELGFKATCCDIPDASEDDIGFAFGAGLNIDEKRSIELGYESYDVDGTDLDMLNFTLRLSF